MVSPLKRWLLVTLLVLAIAAVFISPLVDLPGSALRAYRTALALFWALWAWSVAFVVLLSAGNGAPLVRPSEPIVSRTCLPILDCAFLC